jgi:enoyl-CoA hydratase/carnithine racemase
VNDYLEVRGAEGGVATLRLSRPGKKNALSIDLRDGVSDALDQLAVDESVKVVVITGAGDVFSAGFDLDEFKNPDPDFQRRLWASSDRFHHTLLRFPLPVVAAVNGPALAGGFDLAVLCDLRIAAVSAKFAHPEQAWTDVMFGPLADLVGSAVARELCLTGRPVSAGEAFRLRLVSAVVEADELVAETARWAGQIARAPRDALIRTKAKAIRRAGITADTPTLAL